MHVVERGLEPYVLRPQHAVAKHVAAHVADANHGELLVLGVHTQLAEVALDRFPGAARGNAHLLVVIAVAAAGSEGVVQPEAVFGGNAVGNVGNVAVPLSAATTRYESSPSWRTTCFGGTTRSPSRLSVMSSMPLIKLL